MTIIEDLLEMLRFLKNILRIRSIDSLFSLENGFVNWSTKIWFSKKGKKIREKQGSRNFKKVHCS